jgi:polysaccharide deacetylase family protein (PEP-CTERM system associated)
VKQTLWALDILAEEGFRTDSSVFPIRHDLYGMPEAPRFPHWRGSVFEFPPSTIQLLGNNIGIGGGGYLRILPYRWTRWALRRLNRAEKQPAMVYFHPWEIDPDQPRIAASVRSRLRHYTGQAGMEKKLDRLLSDFPFGALSEVCRDLAVYRKGAGAAEESATEDARREA